MGLQIEQLNEIVVYTFTDSSEESVDTWVISLEGLFQETPPTQPFHALVDVSAQDVDFNAHARQKSAELFTRYASHHGYIAFIFTGVTAPHYARIFFAGLGPLSFEVEFFETREAGLGWLRDTPGA